MNNPSLIPVFKAKVHIGEAQFIGETNGYQRRIVPVLGGEVFGELIQGEILAGGSDWQQLYQDRIQIETRYTIRTIDGYLIYMINKGLRMVKKHDDQSDETYMRTNTFFEAPQGPYQWLNESVFISTANKTDEGIEHEFYQLT